MNGIMAGHWKKTICVKQHGKTGYRRIGDNMKPIESKKKRHDEIMRYAGKLEAILLLLDDIESVDYDAISETEYDELITQPFAHIFAAKEIIEKYAKGLVK
jgi:hypothetical protein